MEIKKQIGNKLIEDFQEKQKITNIINLKV